VSQLQDLQSSVSKFQAYARSQSRSQRSQELQQLIEDWVNDVTTNPLSKHKKFDADDNQYSGADGTISTFVSNIKHICAIYQQRLDQQENHIEQQAIH